MKASDGTPRKGADRPRKKKPKNTRTRAKPVSLYPLEFDDALSALIKSASVKKNP